MTCRSTWLRAWRWHSVMGAVATEAAGRSAVHISQLTSGI